MRAPDPEAVKAAADRAEARAGRDEPRGRGRLSALDQLPEEAQEDVVWAVGQLNARDRTQADILFELNDRLAAKGIDAISRSAFNRASMKLAMQSKRLAEARRLFEGLAPELTPERMDENGLVIGEFIKLLLFELAQKEGHEVGAKGAMEIARGYLAVIQAQRISADRKVKREADFKAAAEQALDRAAAAKGLSAETVEGIRREMFGVPTEASRGA